MVQDALKVFRWVLEPGLSRWNGREFLSRGDSGQPIVKGDRYRSIRSNKDAPYFYRIRSEVSNLEYG